jgi:hypothetical protein
MKGMLVGLLCSWFARKAHPAIWGIAVGSAAADRVNGRHPYLQVMLPGCMVGALVGFLTRRTGQHRAESRA